MIRRRARILIFLVALACSSATVAYGFVTATSTRGASDPGAKARSLPAGTAPTVSASGGDVTVSIPQSAVAGQNIGEYAAGGYVVRRYAASATVDGTGATPSGTCASLVSGSVATLACTDTAVAAGSWTYTVTPALRLWRGAESAASAAVTVAAGDTTPPQLVSLEMRDNDVDGKVDRVVATFDEVLASSTDAAPWALANVPGGGSLASVATASSVATLVLNEGAAHTAVGSFTVALSSSASGIRDAAGNQASFAATAPADKAGPVPTGLVFGAGTLVGRFQENDTMTVTFSEALAPLATPATSNVQLTGANPDTVAIPGLLAATVSLGRNDYITGNSTATFTSSLTNPAGNQARVTLGACTPLATTCTNVAQAGATGQTNPFVFTPAPSILDPAGNAAAGSFSYTGRVF